VQSYLYSGFNGQIIFTGQPWFAPKTGGSYNCTLYPSGGWRNTGNHPCSGYSENVPGVIQAQINLMIAEGKGPSNTVVRADDWYGNFNGKGFLNQSVMQEYIYALSLCTGSTYASCPIGFTVMVDGGGLPSGMYACPSQGAYYCPTGASNAAVGGCDQSACTQAEFVSYIETVLDYIDSAWAETKVWTPSIAHPSHHELILFYTRGDFANISNWFGSGGVWPTIQAYQVAAVASGKYKALFDTFNWSNDYNLSDFAANFSQVPPFYGAYLWSHAPGFSNSAPQTQYYWDSNENWQATFYTKGEESSQSSGIIAGEFPGFESSNNNYDPKPSEGPPDIISRMCGRTYQFLSGAILNASPTPFSASNQLPAVMMQTWNDLGEGTNIEYGVDNCWRPNAPTYNAGTTTLTWTVSATDTTASYGATSTTIDHFKILFGNGSGPLYTAQDNISKTAASCTGTFTLTCSYNLSSATKPPFPGYTWNVYVKMVPLALDLTQTSSPLVQAF
jgi:hypothetical protein